MNNPEEKMLEHILQRMQTDHSVDAPADVIKYAKNLYRTRATEPNRSVIQRVLAVMTIDLAPNRAAFGERSAGSGQARQVLFESGENAVDLRVSNVENRFDIRGQILGDGFANGEIEIAGKKNSFTARLDELSTFRLAAIPEGEYNISIRGENSELFIESLILK